MATTLTRRLAVVASHPVQYQAAWFRALAKQPGLELEVLYGHYASGRQQAEAGFGVEFDWDIPLLSGYEHRFLANCSADPTANSFAGVDTPEVGSVLRKGRFDAVLVCGWHTRSYLQALQACWREGRPVMVRSDSHLHDARPVWLRVAKEIPYRYLVSRVDACLPVGVWSREYFLRYGADPERVFVVPHCVSPNGEAENSATLRASARSAWNIPDADCVALFAGKFIERKRVPDFIRAVAAASRECRIVGLIAGDGPLRESAERLAAETGASVRFAGFLNQREIGRAYAAADVLVLPSSQETWGLVVNEAMSWGLPCIVSDLTGCGPDLIQDGETGFIFPTGDVVVLARHLARLARDPRLRAEMGRVARSRIAAYTPEAAADATIRALDALVPTASAVKAQKAD